MAYSVNKRGVYALHAPLADRRSNKGLLVDRTLRSASGSSCRHLEAWIEQAPAVPAFRSVRSNKTLYYPKGGRSSERKTHDVITLLENTE